MSELFFEIHGVGARLHSTTSVGNDVLHEIKADFKPMGVAQLQKPALIEIDIGEQTSCERERKPVPRLVYNSAMAAVHGWGKTRVCLYHGGVRADSLQRNGVRHFEVSGADRLLIREVVYQMLLSAFGEELDRRGLHRIHAFGFETHGRRALLVAPSGAGKSTLAHLMHEQIHDFKLFSDESPLLSGERMHAFPLRPAIAPAVAEALGFSGGRIYERKLFGAKLLYPFPEKSLATSGPIDLLLIGVRSNGQQPAIHRRRRWQVIPQLFSSLVIGFGLAQMAEWMLRTPALARLIVIALRRVWTMMLLLARAESVYEFHLGPDARANFACLVSFLGEQHDS